MIMITAFRGRDQAEYDAGSQISAHHENLLGY